MTGGILRGLAGVIVLVGVVACGTNGAPGAAGTTPAPAPPPVETTPWTPVETTAAETAPTATDTPTYDEPAEEPSSSTPAVLRSSDGGRSLTLADVFNAEGNWEESRYDVADRRDIAGIGVTLDGCGEYGAAELELRLARNFKRLTMSVGQANNSPSSEDQLMVAVIANGRQEDTRRIPFDRIQPFDINVSAVNALRLRFWVDDDDECTSEGVIGVVEKLTLYG